MLLSEFYANHFAPIYLACCKKTTHDAYKQILDFWISELNDDPELSKISPGDCEQFVSLALAKVKPDTVAKYCRHMNTMFLKMAKPGYRNREAFGFLENPPYCKPPRLMKRLPKEVSDRQLIKHIEALSDIKNFPKCVEQELRPKWWKTLCLFVATAVGFFLPQMFAEATDKAGNVSMNYSQLYSKR